jgi:YD repeat-containing protein
MARLSSWTLFAVAVVSLAAAGRVTAQSPIQYGYDDLGRLIAVIDPAGATAVYTYDAVGNLLSIGRQASAALSIIGFAPRSGPAGATVTILGTGFSPTPSQNTVAFNGVAAAVTSSTATRVVTTVPTGATTGPIAVTTPSGSVTSGTAFTVMAASGAPTLTGFTPTFGAPGDAVTITGTSFETTPTNDKVDFNVTNPVHATVTAATTTSLLTTVPSGATPGKLSVATPAGTAISTDDFFVLPVRSDGHQYTASEVAVTGRMTVDGPNLTVTIGTAGTIALVVFEGAAGQRVSLGLSAVTIGTSDVTLYAPSGSQVGFATVVTTGGAIDAQLVAAGTYAIAVAPRPGFTGSATLTLSQEVTGSLTVDGAAVPVSLARPGQRARLTFAGTAGQRVSVHLAGISITSGTVSVLNPDGTSLGSGVGFGVGADATLDAPPLPATGTYSVLVDPANAYTGNLTLSLSQELTGTIAVDGAPVTATLTRAGQRLRLTFGGTAGQRLSLGLTGSTLTTATATISNPDGTTLASGIFATSNTALDTPTPLAATGTYALLIDPSQGFAGTVTLTLSSEVTGALTIGGAATPVTIARAGQRARMTFEGTAGQRLSVNMTGSALPSGTATVFTPSGSTLVAQGFSGSGGFIDPRTLGATGTYSLLVDPNLAFTGGMTLTLYGVPDDVTGTLAVNGSAQTVTTTAPGQNAVLTFTGNAGQPVTVHGANSTQGCVTVLVKRPDNATASISPCTASYSLTTTSSTAGTFTLTLDPIGTSTGSVDVNVTNP